MGDYINTGEIKPARKTPSLSSVNPEISENLSINRGFPEAFNCDLEKSGSVIKVNSAQGILYAQRVVGLPAITSPIRPLNIIKLIF